MQKRMPVELHIALEDEIAEAVRRFEKAVRGTIVIDVRVDRYGGPDFCIDAVTLTPHRLTPLAHRAHTGSQGRTTMKTATARTPATVAALAPFLVSLGTTTGNCLALCDVKGPAAKIIPAGIRQQMRSLARLNTYWNANNAAYNALLEASQGTGNVGGAPRRPAAAAGTTKARRAGA